MFFFDEKMLEEKLRMDAREYAHIYKIYKENCDELNETNRLVLKTILGISEIYPLNELSSNEQINN